ncbi:MAG: ferredoxin family protein [Candidatus Binatia bacterium]|jgi:2-oxoglutarate ferredoxin oxidoreductase subunit delta
MPKGYITVDAQRCKGCALCIEFCPKKVIVTSRDLNSAGYYAAEFVNADGKGGCTGCAICGLVCPEVVIEVFRDDH